MPIVAAPPHKPLPSTPLTALFVALAALGLPLWDHAASWAVILFMVCLGTRLFLNYRRLPLPSAWLKIAVLAAGTAAIFVGYGDLVGIESAFGILLILVGLKVIETQHARDLGVLTLIGVFLGLCALFFDQDLARWLYIGAAYTLLLSARVSFYYPARRNVLRTSLLQTLKFIGQALPLTVLLFLFFPRVYGDFRFFFGSSLLGSIGLSDRLSPGSVAAIAARTDVAFRVSFPDGDLPQGKQLYWRGIVLWDGTGLAWERGGPSRPQVLPGGGGGKNIRQHITLEPYGENWLFALDRPTSQVAHAHYESGGALRSQRHIYTRMSYDVTSQTENQQTRLWPDELAAALRTPSRVSPAVRELAASWRSNAADEEAIVRRGLHFFKTSGFLYSLAPGTYTSPELDEFLFQRRIGFCEHFAASFASLMRLAQVPARVVVGYLGGEYNAVGKYMIVRQSDAHSWCEVWLKGQGWVRVDPTSVIAPERVDSGLQQFMEGRRSDQNLEPAQGGGAAQAWQNLQRQVRLYWDNLSYQWNLRVLSFDRDSQRSFLAVLGLVDWKGYSLVTALAYVLVIMLGGLLLWLRRAPKAALGDPARRWYARYCARLARAGVPRSPSEGPLQYAARAARHLPAHASDLQHIGDLYVGLLYSRTPPPLADFIRAVRGLPKLSPPPRTPDSTPISA